MPTYKAPVEDVLFLLNDVFHLDRYDNLPGFADATPDLVEAILAEAAKFCEEVLAAAQPRRRQGRLQAPRRRQRHHADRLQGRLRGNYVEGGWIGISAPTEFGGQGLPATLTDDRQRDSSAPPTWRSRCIRASRRARSRRCCVTARPSRRRLYLPKMVAGEWTGTMNLTEPHCGTDLGLLRTKAAPQADGSYKITGTKIFISAGEHDLAENIIHLVLARIEGAPAGTKGISLFIVPKFMLNADGSLGARNARHLRLDRGEDGHPRQRHLRDELRRRHRLAGRRGEPRPQRHVHDDERGAARRRRAGPGACPRSPIRTPRSTPRSACRAARSPARSPPTSRPIRSSCIPTCAAR